MWLIICENNNECNAIFLVKGSTYVVLLKKVKILNNEFKHNSIFQCAQKRGDFCFYKDAFIWPVMKRFVTYKWAENTESSCSLFCFVSCSFFISTCRYKSWIFWLILTTMVTYCKYFPRTCKIAQLCSLKLSSEIIIP